MNQELIRELQDDIRREKYEKIWRSFGRAMVWVSAAVVVATIVTVVWQNHTRSRAMEKTSEFIRGIDRLMLEDYKGAIVIFEGIAKDTKSNYYGPAMLRIAQAKLGLSDKEGALAAYEEAADKDEVFGQLARMALPAKNGDVMKPQGASPFYFSLSELRAWKLLEAGEKDVAVAQFLALYEDNKTPFSMRMRVTEALQHLAPQRLHETDQVLKQKAAGGEVKNDATEAE